MLRILEADSSNNDAEHLEIASHLVMPSDDKCQ